ncbi:sickle tail protein homolog isoform X2 [Paramisgurnus dabryanus]|uniref:sickle tail protein homolog isoform X2 n=1 Tax=Paramisgurnus dabryanus TaxID=90735 RepID=UPI0031F47941
MQSYSIDHKREAFLEHLKLKYPNHASVIMGHQERFREQVRSSVRSVTPQSAVGESGEPLSLACLSSLEAMSEGEALSAFTRGSRSRASLPVVKSNNQTKDRSLGVLYLQYGEDTKQIRMPNELTSADTIKALFVSAFPQQLSMKTLESPNVAIYIKDDTRNMYYELTDVRNITPHSCLKVYHKDPAQAFNQNIRTNNGDARTTRERLYSSRQQPGSPINSVQGSLSPPTPRSVPSSPSRISYSHSVSTLPRERIPSVPPSRSNTSCTSAILERRDVKPDEDLGTKSISVFADPYATIEARLSIASSQGSHTGDTPDGVPYIQHRSSIKSTGTYADGQDQHTLYRQRSLKYSETKTPPASPQRVNEVRMFDMPSQGMTIERASAVRRSLRKESNGNMDVVTRVRGNMASPVFADFPPGHGDRPFQGDPQSVRIKAMEQQIASLTGLVQHALYKGTNTSAKETMSEKTLRTASPAHNINSGGVYAVASSKDPAVNTDPLSSHAQVPVIDSAVSPLLFTFKRNVSDLRLQLYQLKQLQLQNQDTIRMMLRQAEKEISGKLSVATLRAEDPVLKQKVQVEEERHKYMCMEENVLLQLGDLENYVEKIKRKSTSDTGHQAVTLKDVEEGAVNLRKVGEALAALKGEFPDLQTKMRTVLRVEVEAVRFLKEEPHKMDSMLKRVKALTDNLSALRRYATESQNHQSDIVPVKTVTDNSIVFTEGCGSPKPVRNFPAPQSRSPTKVSTSEPTPLSPYTVHRVWSPPLTPIHTRDSSAVALVNPRSRENSPVPQKRVAPQGQEALPNTTTSTGSFTQTEINFSTNKSTSEEVSERASEYSSSLVHSPGRKMEKEMDRILQHTQANLLKAIPDLELSKQESYQPASSLPDKMEVVPMSPQPEATPQDGPKAEKPARASLERPQKPTMEKPHRASVDRVKPNPENACKSPPPPPPRKFYTTGTGHTGEVVFTTRKESTSAQEAEEEAPEPKPLRAPPEVKPKPCSPPPVNTSTLKDEEDEGDKIMAELQVFQKCTVKDLQPRYIVDLTTHEPSINEKEPGFSFSHHKTSTHLSEEGTLSESREGSGTPASSGVVYCITGTTTKTYEADDLKDPAEATFPSSKVASENTSDLSQRSNLLTSDDVSLTSFNSVKEIQSKFSNPQHSVNFSRNGPGALKEMSLITPIESLRHVAPTAASEKVTPVETSEQQIVYTSNMQDQETPVKQGQRMTTVEVTLVSKSAEYQVQAPVSQPSSDPLWASQPCDDSVTNIQEVITRSSQSQDRYTEDASLSPDLPGEEAPPPPNNIAFRITKSKVQALSTGEYQQLVNSKGTDVQTLRVGSEPNLFAPEDPGYDKKPVIIIFDEPMDIQQAYKRLSTIFECEEELERVLSEERIDEEPEEEEEEEMNSMVHASQTTPRNNLIDPCRTENRLNNQRSSSVGNAASLQVENSFESSLDVDDGDKIGSSKDAKKKFKFKFPKKQLAAIGQALRKGDKTGKKTLQVVVYEDEEEPDGTLTEHKEAKRFEIKPSTDPESTTSPSLSQSPTSTSQSAKDRTEEIRKTTYQTLDSLEQTIKQLESTISDIGPALSCEVPYKDTKLKRNSSQVETEQDSPTKTPPPLKPKPHKSSQHKRPKSQSRSSTSALGSSSSSSSSSKQSSPGDSPASSRISSPNSRQKPVIAEKPAKPGKPQKLQDSQRQFRQVVLL